METNSKNTETDQKQRFLSPYVALCLPSDYPLVGAGDQYEELTWCHLSVEWSQQPWCNSDALEV